MATSLILEFDDELVDDELYHDELVNDELVDAELEDDVSTTTPS